MKKLLFVTPELPFPPQSGGKVKSLKLLHALAERYEVMLACPLKGEDAKHVDAFHAVSPCFAHLHERLDVPRSAYQLATSYVRRWPLNVQRTHHPVLARKIGEVVDDFDVVMLDHYEVFPYVPDTFRGLRVYHAHNAYHKLWARYATLPGNPAVRAAAWLEAGRVRRSESAVARRSDLVFAAPNDATELIASGVAEDRIRNTYHLGDDRQLDLPSLRFSDSRKRLMYVGFLGWEANALGLLWFIESVWPTLASRHPDLDFHIVGKGADSRLTDAVARHPGIHLRGFVDDLETVYRGSRVSVAPLRFGSGMKVKVLDAMARGMPTVTTSVGAEGITAESGCHLLIADDAEGTVRHIEALLEDPGLWFRLQSESRELVRAQYTWRRLFDGMQQDLRDALQRHQHESRADRLPVLGHAA
jgi:glycosyltransferase involved in cell wall biosynthesis